MWVIGRMEFGCGGNDFGGGGVRKLKSMVIGYEKFNIKITKYKHKNQI